MKKLLLLCGAVLVGMGANAQLAMENFNSPGIPANWVRINADGLTPSTSFTQAIQDSLAVTSWMKWPVGTGDSAMLTVSWFSPAGKADRWLITPAFTVTDPNMIIKWQDYAADPSYTDSMQVWVSPTAGTTVPDFTAKLYDQPGGTEGLTQRGLNLGAYNGQTIRLAFRDNSTDEYVLYMDNVGTSIPANPVDAKADSLIFKTLVTGASTPVNVIVSNQGAQNITSLQLQYVVDAGTPVVQTFNSLNIYPYGTATLSFTTPVSGLTPGSHTITFTVNQTNGAPDPVAGNNTKTKVFAVVDPNNSVTRNGLIEEFSSSTCVPCASFNSTFDPLVVSNHANDGMNRFNVVKYQMNWPSPGNDQSYNTHGETRRAFYGVTGIPDHFTNGATGGAGNQAEIDGSKTDPAYMTITGTYTVNGSNLEASATITPKFTITGANFKVYMAATERQYTNNNATTTQLNYVYVERTMFPDGNGTTVANWTANTPQTFNFTKAYVNGGPAQGNDNFWTSGIQSDLVVFVQDANDHSVLQSAAFPAQWPAGVKELNGINDMAVFPNPATSQAILGFNTTEKTSIDVSVVDALGRSVYNYSQVFQAGSQRIMIPTASFAAGVYNVRVQTANGVATRRLTVVK